MKNGKGKKEKINEKKRAALGGYDRESCYCLLIAVAMGLNAREARMLYRYGPENPACRKILEKQRKRCLREGKAAHKKNRKEGEKE